MISDTVYMILNIVSICIISYLLCILVYQIFIDWNTEPKIMRHEYIPGTLKNNQKNIPGRLEIPNNKIGEIRKWI